MKLDNFKTITATAEMLRKQSSTDPENAGAPFIVIAAESNDADNCQCITYCSGKSQIYFLNTLTKHAIESLKEAGLPYDVAEELIVKKIGLDCLHEVYGMEEMAKSALKKMKELAGMVEDETEDDDE